MFAPFVLPFQITLIAFAVLWCVGALTLRSPKRIAGLSLAALLLFIPSCFGVKAVVDLQRYGRFDYANASEIPKDGYIELPENARHVTLYRNGFGHWGKFQVDTVSLRSWIDESRALRPDLNQHHVDEEWLDDVDTNERPEVLALKQQIFAERFPETGWTYEPAMREVHVNRSDRGGGYSVWHVPSTGDTYISTRYW